MSDRSMSLHRTLVAALGAAIFVTALPVTTASAQTSPPPAAASTANDKLEEIVVTGSILRRTDTETASPITVVTAESIEQRGQTTIQDAIQSLSANNGPALTNSFTANGAFAGGASAVSLRGLSTNSTLVLFDGMRAAYYPLADDGTRNFVDLNAIPDAVIDQVQVLRDGASSSYGADAIAGVVNIITKRQFTGLSFRAEGGHSTRGDARNSRFSAMAGRGDLASDGYNGYVSLFWEQSASLKNSDRPYPYNSFDQSGKCYGGVCGPDLRVNGFNPDGTLTGFSTTATVNYVRPFDATNTRALGPYQFINPTTGCGKLPAHTVTPADGLSASAPTVTCLDDRALNYDYILPEITRFGLTGRMTLKVGESSEAYGQFNFLQSSVSYYGRTPVIRANGPAGILYPAFRNDTGPNILTLPIYVCPERINCGTSAQRRLNPNNPFAAAGNVARLIGRIPDGTLTNDATRERTYRVAGGIKGTVFNDWDYNVGITGMHTDLLLTSNGYVYIQRLLDVVADGSYNFVDPTQNSLATHDYLFPTKTNIATSDLYQWQATANKSLITLDGGPLQLGFGVSQYYEAVNAPSGNPDYNGPTQRYFVLNAFGTKGNRNDSSAFFEVQAPFTKMIEASVAGRYDSYSSGQTNFSPKIGLKFKPIKELVVRATFSKGYRIPSIAEAAGLPTTGYVTANASTFPDSYLSQFGVNCSKANFGGCPAYITGATIGETTLSSASLKAESSRSFTFGVVAEPLHNLSLTLDYYDIKKTDAITNQTYAGAIAAYYAGQTIPTGFAITPDAPDVNNPAVLPRISLIAAGFVNANTVTSKGIDFTATGKFRLSAVKWTSMIDGSYIRELNTTFPDGHVEKYAGTLGNFNLTAGSGTPRWHGYWQNNFNYDKYSATLTMNYFGGYNLSAEDQEGANTAGDCGLSPYNPTYCNVPRYITWDLVGSADVTKNINVYFNLINLTDRLPPYDPVTYGANAYNPVQGGEGIIGRAFRLGIKAKF